MQLRLISDTVAHGKPTDDPIIAVSQFFIHPDPARHNEIQFCLFANVVNPEVSRIILLNEREYTIEELGLKQPTHKIEQVIIKKRLTYAESIRQVNALGLSGYVVLHNADIFFDESLGHILVTDSSVKPTLYAQLRWEFCDYSNVKIFGPRADSQDAWIWHTNFNDILLRNAKIFNFELGKPGCDNALIYLFKIFGFRIVNDPQFIHVFHYHMTQIRDYNNKDRIKDPYGTVFPIGCEANFKTDMALDDVDLLYDYILKKGNEPYVVPRVGGIEAICAHNPEAINSDQYKTMRNNAGIQLSNVKSAKKWAKQYMTAFHNCELYTGWDKNHQDRVYRGISRPQDHIDSLGKRRIWAHGALDVFEQIERRPWTLALRGKRILIVSQLEESIREQMTKPPAYGVDLFPDCSFVFLRPPQTAGNEMSLEFDEELAIFYRKLEKITDYDIALVSAGGYGNIIANKIFSLNKQAIYVGGVLQMYWGILGQRWLVERGLITGLYLNEHWTRAKNHERPAGHKNIEGGCYW